MLSPNVEASAPDGAVVGENVILPQEGSNGCEKAGEEELVNLVEERMCAIYSL